MGNLPQPDENYTDKEIVIQARKDHARRTGEWVREHLKIDDEIIKSHVAQICEIHSTKEIHRITEIQETGSILIEGKKYECRLKFLSAILNLSDTLDQEFNRLPPEFIITHSDRSQKDVEEYYRHKITQKITIYYSTQTIYVALLLPKTDFARDIQSKLEDELVRDFNSVKGIINEGGIGLNKIEFLVNYDPRLKGYDFEIEGEKLDGGLKPIPLPIDRYVSAQINLLGFKIKAVLLGKEGFVWGLAGIILALVSLGWYQSLLPLVLPSLAIYCGYKSKFLGNRKIGNLVIFLGLVFMVIRIALLTYGVSHTTDVGTPIISGIPPDWTELKKSRIFLLNLSYLISLILVVGGIIVSFLGFVWSVFKGKEMKVVRRSLIWVTFTGILLNILTSGIVVKIFDLCG